MIRCVVFLVVLLSALTSIQLLPQLWQPWSSSVSEQSNIPAKVNTTTVISQKEFTLSEEEKASLIVLGEKLYFSDRMDCYNCHGFEGEGMNGPNIINHAWLKDEYRTNFHRMVTEGTPDEAMRGVPATRKETDALRYFIQTFEPIED